MSETPPIYIEVDPETIIDEMVAYHEAETGNTLQPAQVERLLFSGWANREALLRSQVQAAAIQNLVSFATEPVLDYLGLFHDVVRLDAQEAIVTIQFTLVAGHGGVTIPSGTRIGSSDGQAVFKTQGDIIVPAVDLTATAVCVSVTGGESFNGYAIGLINNILDPQAYLVSASNTDVTAGGSDRETDEQLRSRIRLAPDSFGTAGSRNAYKFWAFSANPLIIDVSVDRPIAGTVQVWVLIADGQPTPQLILDQVYATLNDDDVRPLTDTVIVTAPTQIPYTIDAEVTIYNTADPTDVEAVAEAALNEFVAQQGATMGMDVIVNQLESAAISAANGAIYNIDFGALTDITVGVHEYAWCGSVNVTIVGTTVG